MSCSAHSLHLGITKNGGYRHHILSLTPSQLSEHLLVLLIYVDRNVTHMITREGEDGDHVLLNIQMTIIFQQIQRTPGPVNLDAILRHHDGHVVRLAQSRECRSSVTQHSQCCGL